MHPDGGVVQNALLLDLLRQATRIVAGEGIVDAEVGDLVEEAAAAAQLGDEEAALVAYGGLGWMKTCNEGLG